MHKGTGASLKNQFLKCVVKLHNITQKFTYVYCVTKDNDMEIFGPSHCTGIVLLIVGCINHRDGINAPTKGDPSRTGADKRRRDTQVSGNHENIPQENCVKVMVAKCGCFLDLAAQRRPQAANICLSH